MEEVGAVIRSGDCREPRGGDSVPNSPETRTERRKESGSWHGVTAPSAERGSYAPPVLGDIFSGIGEAVFEKCLGGLWNYLRGGKPEDDSGRPRHRRTIPAAKDEPTRAAARRRMRERRDAAIARRRKAG